MVKWKIDAIEASDNAREHREICKRVGVQELAKWTRSPNGTPIPHPTPATTFKFKFKPDDRK